MIPHDPRDHHPSHTHLLRDVDAERMAGTDVDAVIVPTARPVDCLRESMRLAGELDRPLVALCSRSASAANAAELGHELDTEVIAVDLHGVRRLASSLATDALLAGTRFECRSDLSLKRNLGLLLSRVAGWHRVLFLDDDISSGCADHVRAAAGLLDDYGAVGLRNNGYADNSVVCHAYRAVGGDQATFIGAGAMVVAPHQTRSFFPNVYNEDWFFLLGDPPPHRFAVTGSVFQKDYDPFADPVRARNEELGDTLAEGLYWLLDEKQPLASASPAFWRDFLNRRRRFIHSLLTHVQDLEPKPENRDDMIASLEAAQRISSFITPKLCVDYLQCWETDLARWRDHLAELPRRSTASKALWQLGLRRRAFFSQSQAEHQPVPS